MQQQQVRNPDIARASRHGGFTLVSAPAEISVWDVIDAVDPIQRIRSCPLGLKEHGIRLCPLHRRLDDALALVETAFRDSTLGDLIREPSKSKPLCEFPNLPPRRRGA